MGSSQVNRVAPGAGCGVLADQAKDGLQDQQQPGVAVVRVAL